MIYNRKSCFFALLAGTALTSPAFAADQKTDQPTVPEIIVTGSALPTSPDQIAVPVSVVDAEAIAKALLGK